MTPQRIICSSSASRRFSSRTCRCSTPWMARSSHRRIGSRCSCRRRSRPSRWRATSKIGRRTLAHAIFAPPDFDQVLMVKSVSADLTDRDLEQDVRVAIPDRKNVAKERLREGQRVEGMLRIGAGAPTKVQLEIGRRIYFEEGEL